MKVNGDLEVLGLTEIKIKELVDYEFTSSDKGLLFLDSNTLKLNTGEAVVSIETADRLDKLASTLGSWLLEDLSLNPLAFNTDFNNVSGLNSSSTLLDALKQIDVAIPDTYVQTFSSPSTNFTVLHRLTLDICNVTVKNLNNNQKIKDSDMTITFTNKESLSITLNEALPIKVLVSAI